MLSARGDTWTGSFAETGEPGLHRVALPSVRAGREGGPVEGDAGFPFVVLGDPAESRLSGLTDADLERVGRHVGLFRARTTQEMKAALVGDIPGQELWKQLAACALLALLAEIAVAGWITIQRRSHSAEEVSFGVEVVDSQSLRDKLRERPAASPQEP